MNKRETGAQFEEKAAVFLQEEGLVIRRRNYRCSRGEIDIIAEEGPTVVFVEVKYRTGAAQGGPLCAVDLRKQKKISEAALWYLTTVRNSVDLPCRFDVIGIEGDRIDWVRDAFPARIRGFF